jgi:hypothetical protein
MIAMSNLHKLETPNPKSNQLEKLTRFNGSTPNELLIIMLDILLHATNGKSSTIVL